MESMPKILLIGEIASLLKVSIPTLRRWLRESRRGQRSFPLPISEIGGKCRWLASDIENYLTAQSVGMQVVSTVRETKRDQKDFQRRQEEAEKSLAKHRINSTK